MERLVKLIIIPVILVCVAFIPAGCGSESSEAETPQTQTVTVHRGDLTMDIVAAGNLALSTTEDLPFDLFYQEGTVEEVLVEEGDTVEQGQVLVKLDTEEWEEQLSALEDRVTDAEGDLTAKKRDLLQNEINEMNAESALENAQDDWLDSIGEGRKVRRIEERLNWYTENDPEDLEEINRLEKDLELAWNAFFRVVSDSTVVAREVTAKEIGLEITKGKLEDAQIAIEDAQKDLDDAQKDLEEAKSKSSMITAPFDGFITKVNVEGGDEVLKGTVAVQLADPNRFEADIMVSEMDILQVQLGGEASVQVDAISGLTLPAKVTHISPTATIQSGVVNYEVKVEVASFEEMMQERQGARQEAMQRTQPGQLPERLQQAIEEGRMTQEQAEEMMKQMQQAQGGQQAHVPTAMPENFQLREGLSVTVSIILAQRSDVLLVPNAAITNRGWQDYVQLVSPDGILEERAIQTGISNWQYTEVTEGLSEGEEVILPQSTATTAPTTQRGRGAMPFIARH
ncbi:efflux RND transporter periplasmic adaptor subunit [Chloroflexota bacterium]